MSEDSTTLSITKSDSDSVEPPEKKAKPTPKDSDDDEISDEKIEELEKYCRLLEARKQEIIMKEEMRFRMQPSSIAELRAMIRDMMFMLEEQSQSLISLECDNQMLRERLEQKRCLEHLT
mmetsp:Transcript_10558/g.12833  ORF Transcript_10558/g.12833 Transcript_10558/m.12833 type:complete len:120 (+) Transcript_10558:85-444(+)